MTSLEHRLAKFASSRRNLIKLGAIAASAVFATTTSSDPVAASAVNCFMKGTAIRTTTGTRKVEALVVGDGLPTIFGGARSVQWIGRYPFKKADPSQAWVKNVWPVRVARSALAPNLPHRDFFVSRYHALFIDGVLVPAGSLINGTTITLHDPGECDELEYFHIKLAAHDVIYAEGAPCESLLTVDEGAVNFAEYFRQYGAPATEETPCAPLLSFNGGRSELKSRFRSAMAPWIDRRNQLDIIRDRLEARGIAMSRRSPELVS